MTNKITHSNKLFIEGLIIISILVVMGIVNLYSALYEQGQVSQIFFKHLFFVGFGALLVIVVQITNVSFIENSTVFFYILCCLLLICVIFFGKKVYGAKRWIALGSFSFQPSELIKLVMIFYIAKYYRYIPICDDGYKLNHLLFPMLLTIIPVLFIMKQPDLGTAIIVFSTVMVIILVLGINKKLIIVSCATAILLSPVMWLLLKDYQKKRITAFISPEADPLGAGYHTIQANIAIGTGGFWGKGYLKGVQSKLGFIPEKHTDFVFSVFAEEWGLIGVAVYILLNLMLFHWMYRVIKNIKDRFVFLSGIGIIALFSLHLVINLSMVTGLFPVVGVPLPLFSYGGTALIVHFTALGFLLKVSKEH